MQWQVTKGTIAGYKRLQGRLQKAQGRLAKMQRKGRLARKGANAGYKRRQGTLQMAQRLARND